jgi:hypothetical protein
MRTILNGIHSVKGLPLLPRSIITKDGAVFDPRSEDWDIANIHHGIVRLKFGRFSNLTDDAKHKLKIVLCVYAQNSSHAHLYNLYLRFVSFYRSELSRLEYPCDQVFLSHLLNYKSKLDRATEWKLGVLRILFVNMEEMGYGILSDEAARFLRDATFKGNPKGTSIRTRDPESGAFNDNELLSIQSALNHAYADGEIDLSTYAMAWLFLAYGVRPIQIAALKEKDLVVCTDANGARFYALRVPSAKKHGERTRNSFKTRYCSKQVGLLVDFR